VPGFSAPGSHSLAGIQPAHIDFLTQSRYPHGDQTTRDQTVLPVCSGLLAVSSWRGHFSVVGGAVVIWVGEGGLAMELKSSTFEAGEMIPKKYTCDGQDVSPPLSWSAVPNGANSLALIADDPDAPMGTWVHWVVWNIPANALGLEEDQPKRDSLLTGMKQGMSDFRRVGYGGPCPPSGTHRYFFKLYALDTMLNLPSSTTKKELEKAMQGHLIQQAELMGKYRRK
jgi:Raf kinase inhibitor-like YbhB/YbcL family protein